ncbi:hypothetical protein D3C72_1932870 [compost metagenome]
MGGGEAGALHDVGFLAHLTFDKLAAGIEHGVASKDIALAAVAGLQVQGVGRVDLPAQ